MMKLQDDFIYVIYNTRNYTIIEKFNDETACREKLEHMLSLFPGLEIDYREVNLRLYL